MFRTNKRIDNSIDMVTHLNKIKRMNEIGVIVQKLLPILCYLLVDIGCV